MDTNINKEIKAALDLGCMKALKRIDILSYIYICHKQWYYMGNPIISDADFDQFEDILKKEWPDNPVLGVVGLIYPKCQCCAGRTPPSKGKD